MSGEFCLNQSKTPDHKYLFVYSFYTQLKVIKGTAVIGDNMVLQGGEKHCNSCGATTRNMMGSRFVPSPGQTSDATTLEKKFTGHDRSATSHFIYLLQLFCTIFSGALFQNASAFQSSRSASYSPVCLRPKRVKHMGGDVFCHPYLEIKGCGELLFLVSHRPELLLYNS